MHIFLNHVVKKGDIGQGRGPMKREDPALEAEIDQGVIPLSGTAAADVDALILVPEELVETTGTLRKAILIVCAGIQLL